MQHVTMHAKKMQMQLITNEEGIQVDPINAALRHIWTNYCTQAVAAEVEVYIMKYCKEFGGAQTQIWDAGLFVQMSARS